MTLDADRRARLLAAKREIAEIMKPQTEAQRKARREAARARRKAMKAAPMKNQRQPRERDPGFLAYLRRLPCVACLVEGGNCGPTEAAHLRFGDARWGRVNPGMSTKPDDKWATPLGAGHHRGDQHMRAERRFWSRLGIDPGELATSLYEDYQQGRDGLVTLARFTGNGTCS